MLSKIWTAAAILLASIVVFAAGEKNFLWQCQVAEKSAENYRIAVSCRIESGYLSSDTLSISAKMPDGKTVTLLNAAGKSEKIAEGIHRWNFFIKGKPEKVTVDFQGCIKSADGSGDICLMPESKVIWQKDKLPSDDPSLIAKNPLSSSKLPSDDPSLAVKMPEDLTRALDKFIYKGKFSGVPENIKSLGDFLAQGKSDTASDVLESDGKTPAMGFGAILLLVILGGLGLNLTPCVLPMIPVNLAIIGADANKEGRFRGFRRGAAYGLGIALTYGVLGLLAALTGSRFGELNSSSIFNWIVAVIFLVLALGMFGVYELDFSRIGNLFPRKSNDKTRKLPPELAAFTLGITAALLAGACVAPVVITIILLAARLYSEGNIWGLGLPFALGLSMALPWPLLGAGMSFLPRPGMWMTRIKQIFGVLILLMAVYYGYLGWNLRSGAFDQAKEISKLTQELEAAAGNNGSVLIDCWASWCKNCHALDKMLESEAGRKMLADSQVKLIRFRCEKLNDPQVKVFMDKYRLPGLPSLILLEGKK